jgi:Holliday junction DNA helicase RuvB
MSLLKSLGYFLCDDDEDLEGDKSRPSFDLGDQHFLRYSDPVSPRSEGQIPTIIVKEQALEDGRIKPYVSDKQHKKILYEPDSLEKYVGQQQAKEQITTAMEIIRRLRPVHILINGWAGCGKTTLARIAANMLDANFIYRVPEQLDDVEKLLDVINLIQSSERLTLFMLDEIHTINNFPRVANVLLPILQEWKYGNADIRPFVMIGATTDKDRLVRKQSPFVSRFQIQITLEKYSPAELESIIRNYKDTMYRSFDIDKEDYTVIAGNSRGIPREAISLLLKQLVVRDIGKVLQQSGIIKDGLTKTDIRILKTLADNEKPMGANYLSQAAGVPQSDYEEIFERFLVEKGYVVRQARGRSITEKGRKLLGEIKNSND